MTWALRARVARGRAIAPLPLVLLLSLAAGSRGFASTPSTASAAEQPATSPAADAPLERARALFARAVELARASDYGQARRLFWQAYETHPHYLVLYNVALCEIQLQQLPEAVATLERFLREGAGQLPTEQRESVEAQLARLRERIAAAAAGHDAPPSTSTGLSATAARNAQGASEPLASGANSTAQPVPPAAVPPAAVPPAAVPPAAVPPAAVPAAVLPPAPVLMSGGPVLLPQEQRAAPALQWGWYAAGGGAVLLGTALGLHLYNLDRHEQWKRQRRALNAMPELETELTRNPELWAAAKQNNERLSAIQQRGVATALMAGAGAVALGVGVWRLLDGHRTDANAGSSALRELRVNALPPQVSWAGQW